MQIKKRIHVVSKVLLAVLLGMSVFVFQQNIQANETEPFSIETSQQFNDDDKTVDVTVSIKEKREEIIIKEIHFNNEAKVIEDDVVTFKVSQNGDYQLKVIYIEGSEEQEYVESYTVDSFLDKQEVKKEQEKEPEDEISGNEEDVSLPIQLYGNELSKDGISISTNKDSGFKWWEDTQLFTSTLKVSKDISLPEGSTREVVLKVDSDSLLKVASLSGVDGSKILSAERIDDNTVKYVVNNDTISNDGISITTSYTNARPFKDTIGVKMLQKAKSEGVSDWGFLLTATIDQEEVAKHKVSVSSELKKLANADDPLIKNVLFSGEGTTFAGGLSDIKLSTDGYTYAGTEPGSYNALKLELTDQDHLPIGNFYLRVYAPTHFNYGGSTYIDQDTKESYGEIRFITDNQQVPGLSADNSGSLSYELTDPLVRDYHGFTTSLNNRGNYFINVAGQSNQFIGLSVGTARDSGLYTNYPIDLLTDGLNTSVNNSKITYDQIKVLDDGSYTIEEKEYDLGKVSVDNDKASYTKVKRFYASVSSPDKVSDEDENVTYHGSMNNLLSTSDINENKISQKHLGGTITFDIPDEFDISELTIPSCYNQHVQIVENYTYTLSNGQEITTPIYEGTGGNTVVFEIPEGEKVTKVVAHLKDDLGFGNRYRQGSDITDMKGTFSAPTSGDKIRMNITVESDADETETSYFEWTYEGHPDNVFYYAYSNDTHLGSDAPSSNRGQGISLNMNGGFSQPSKTYQNAVIDITGGSTLELKTLHPSFNVHSTKQKYEGDGYVVYTTNLQGERKIKIVSDGVEKTGGYTFDLADGEYITSLKVTYDSIKWTAKDLYGSATPMTFYYRIQRDYPGETIDYSQDSIPGKWNVQFSSSNGDTNNYDNSFSYLLKQSLKINQTITQPNYVSSITRGSIIDSELQVKLPVYAEETNSLGSAWNYPLEFADGSKLYIKLNENFDYYGSNSKISKMKDSNGETWLVYDVGGETLTLGDQSRSTVSIPANTIYCTNSATVNQDYTIFEKIYFDVAPQLAKEDNPPYFKYVRGSSLATIDDTLALTGASGEDAKNRLVEIPYTRKTMVVASNIDDIKIIPGVDNQFNYNGKTFTANQHDKLVANFLVGANDKKYTDYKLTIDVPQKGEITSIGTKGSSNYKEIENEYSLKVKDIVIPQVLIDKGYTVEYQDVNGTAVAKEDAKRIVLTFTEIPVKFVDDIQVEFAMKDVDDVYVLDMNAQSAVSAQASFDYITIDESGLETGSKVSGNATSSNMGVFLFDYYTISGKVFKESTIKVPDGLYTSSDTLGGISYLTFKDHESGTKYTSTLSAGGQTYELKLAPRASAYTIAPFISNDFLAINALNGRALNGNDFALTFDTFNTDADDITTNFPRDYRTGGASFKLDETGMSAISNVDGFNNVNVGLYVQPTIKVEPSPQRVKVSQDLDFTITPSFSGKFIKYTPTDGNEYISNTQTPVAGPLDNILGQIKITGKKETYKDNKLSYFNATVEMGNYFYGTAQAIDDIDIYNKNTQYQVYDEPNVKFEHGTNGTWVSGADGSQKIAYLNTDNHVDVSDVPAVKADEKYAFDGWELYRDGTSKGRIDPTQYDLKDNDIIIATYDDDRNEDDIPDKYQIVFSFKHGGNGTISDGVTTLADTNTTDSIEVWKTRYVESPVTSALYSDWKDNPLNWSKTTPVQINASEVPSQSADTYYHFSEWQVGHLAYADANAIEGNPKTNYTADITFTANFARDQITIDFEPAQGQGQASAITTSRTIDKNSSLSDAQIKENGDYISKAKYGYIFDGWQIKNASNTFVDFAADDADLKTKLLIKNETLRPKYKKANYNVSFAINNRSVSNELIDIYGNEISTATGDTVQFNDQIASTKLPTLSEEAVTGLFEFDSWEYTMKTSTGAVGTKQYTNDPSSVAITGDVTFTARFVYKPSLSLNAQTHGTADTVKLTNSTINDFDADTLNGYGTNKELSWSTKKASADTLPLSAGIGYKSDANYKVNTIVIEAIKNDNGVKVSKTFTLYANDAWASDALWNELESDYGIKKHDTKKEVFGATPEAGHLVLTNIGGSNAEVAASYQVDISYKLQDRAVNYIVDPLKGSYTGQLKEDVAIGAYPNAVPVVTGMNDYKFVGWLNDSGVIVNPKTVQMGTEGLTFTAKLDKNVTVDNGIALYGNGFVIENNEAAGLDTTNLLKLAEAKAHVIEDGRTINPTLLTAAQLAAINNAPITGGIYPVDLYAEHPDTSSKTATRRIYVVVKGTWVETDKDLQIYAHGFNLTNAQGKALTSDEAKTKSDVAAIEAVSNTVIGQDKIAANVVQLAMIQGVGSEGGIYPLTFTAVHEGEAVSITVMVNVEGTSVPPLSDYVAIKANNFTLENSEATSIDEDIARTKAKAYAYDMWLNEEIIPTADAAQLLEIKNAPLEGEIYDLKWSASSRDLPTRSNEKNTLVLVKGGTTPQVENDLMISAKSFVLEQSDLSLFDADDAKLRSAVKAFEDKSNNPVASNRIAVDADDLKKIQAAPLEGGIYDLTFTATHSITNETVSVTVKVVVKGGTTNGEYKVGIHAENFEIEHADAKDITDKIARTESLVEAVELDTLSTIEKDKIEVDSNQLSKIANAPLQGGIYDLTFTATHSKDTSKKASVTIKVIVKGGTTPSKENALMITADSFILEQSDLVTFDADDAKLRSAVKAFEDKSNIPIDTDKIEVDSSELKQIQNAPLEGGIYDLTFTATHSITNETISVTVKVVVKGGTTNGEYEVGIHANNFEIENADAQNITAAISRTNSSVTAVELDTTSTIDTDTIEVDEDQLKKIQNAPLQGGIYDLTFTATHTKDTSKKASVTIKVVVKGGTTPQIENDLMISANSFILEQSDLLTFDAHDSKIRSEVVAFEDKSNLPVDLARIDVDATELKAIQDAPLKGGIYNLTFTATHSVTNKTISVTVKVVVKGGTTDSEHKVGITADSFTIENADAKALTKDLSKVNANTYAVELDTMNDIDRDDINVSDEQLKKIQKAPLSGGIYDLTFSATHSKDNSKVVSVTIKVVVKGGTTPGIKDGVAISANSFEIPYAEASAMNDLTAIEKSLVEAYETDTMNEINVFDVDATELNKIKNAPRRGGIYDLTFTATHSVTGTTNSTTIKVVVVGGLTPEIEDSLAITAKGFSIENSEAALLDEANSKIKSEVYACNVVSMEAITTIKVDELQLKEIQKAPKEGGIYDLTFTAIDDQGRQISTTVKVVVKGLYTPEISEDLAITANGFTIPYKDAASLNEEKSKEYSRVYAVDMETNNEIEIVKADETHVSNIQKASEEGGDYVMQFTALSELGTTISTTVPVIVEEYPLLLIDANDFTIEHADAKALDETIAKELGNANPYISSRKDLKSTKIAGPILEHVTVDESHLKEIQAAPEEGGVYPMRYMVKYDEREAEVEVTVTVKPMKKPSITPKPTKPSSEKPAVNKPSVATSDTNDIHSLWTLLLLSIAGIIAAYKKRVNE